MSAFLLAWSLDLDTAISRCEACEGGTAPRLCAAHARESDDWEAAADGDLLDLESLEAALELEPVEAST